MSRAERILEDYARAIWHTTPLVLRVSLAVLGELVLAVLALPGNEEWPLVLYCVQLLGVMVGALLSIGVVRHLITKRYTAHSAPVEWFGRLLYQLGYFGVGVASYVTITSLVFVLAPNTLTVFFSGTYLQIDEWLGVYALVGWAVDALEAAPIVYTALDWAYFYTGFVVLLTLVPLATVTKLGGQFATALLASLLLSVPLWLLNPAVAPYELTQTPTLWAEVSQDASAHEAGQVVISSVAERADTAWAQQILEYVAFWQSSSGSHYAISANPSMHVIWGVLLAYYVWRLRWWLGVPMTMYALVQSIGTILFLQHYLIDIPVGVLVAMVTIWIVNQIYNKEAVIAQA